MKRVKTTGPIGHLNFHYFNNDNNDSSIASKLEAHNNHPSKISFLEHQNNKHHPKDG